MKKRNFLRALRGIPASLCIASLIVLLAAGTGRGEPVANMRGYCSLPPLPGFGVKPNLLLMVDNSASMYDPAYSNPATYCLDDTSDTFSKSPEPYLGYFDPATIYSYNSVNQRFETATGGLPLPGNCNVTDGLADEVVRKNVCLNIVSGKVSLTASGSFLNWLTASKLDVEKMALTGGRFNPATGLLEGETRGCQGKRFIKMLGDAEVTFAVRGPIPGETDFQFQASLGGTTRVEFYPKRYHKDSCLAAVAAWQGGTLAQLKAEMDLCMGNYRVGLLPSKGTIYNEIMADCYSYLASSPPDESIAFDQTLFTDCATRIKSVYKNLPKAIPTGRGEDICGKGLYHRAMQHSVGGATVTYTNGYLGNCYNQSAGTMDTGCGPWQVLDYCAEIRNPSLTDPSATAIKAGTDANVPAVVLDAGIYDLNPTTGLPAATFIARLAPPSTPTGLIQEFADYINIGAMIFNDNGAGSESCQVAGGLNCSRHCSKDPAPQKQCYVDQDCLDQSPGTCRQDTLIDGGKIISYINLSPLGDHTSGSGLIASIDRIRGDAWTPLAESFYEAIGYFASRGEMRLRADDFDLSLPPSKFSCQRNNILMVTDGRSTADRAKTVLDFVAAATGKWVNSVDKMPASQTTTDTAASDPPFWGSYNIDDLAWIARNRNIFDFSKEIQQERDYVSTYVIYSGAPCEGGDCSGSGEEVPARTMELVAANGGGRLLSAQKPSELVEALRSMLQLIGGGANSSTNSSILATGEGNGALFLQEQFYRNKSFDGGATSASWIGEMQGLWYYIDPFIASSGGASAIREDTGGLKILDLKQDRVVRFLFDQDQLQTVAVLYQDTNGDGNLDPNQPTGYPLTVSPDAVRSLWRAGLQLWQRAPADRTIYTQTDGSNLVGLASGFDLSKPANRQLLQAGSQAEAEGILSFVRGTDTPPSTRTRGVTVDGRTGVWKLGDIVSSTPVLQTAASLGNYHLSPGYGDSSYAKFISSTAYQGRGTAYVGANDGMLHAFRIGKLKLRPDPDKTWPATQKGVLLGSDVGEESWAFIPKNALPYLRYLKEPMYPHLYYVDGSSTIADVSIGDPATCAANGYWNCVKDFDNGTNWRTVLIGGMGLGGASRYSDDTSCSEGAAGSCVKSPPSAPGLSSYFALDVTGQTSDGSAAPRLLWEFSPPGLGFATSGAAIVKINAQSGNPPIDDKDKNGRWFAVFASGPTGPIDSGSCQFLGKSDQNLKLFVVDLYASPPLTEGSNYWVIDTGITKAFGGSMSRAGIDTDKWNPNSSGHYEDDALYLGYSRTADDGSWTGGVLRLLTGENLDPAQWKVSKVIDGVGPVTGAVAKLQDRNKHNLWLYLGTGRFFQSKDDLTATRAILGVREPCYTRGDTLADNGTCSATPLRLSDLTDMTSDTESPGAGSWGWWIGLDAGNAWYASERFTDNSAPLTGGAVFFTTFAPPLDLCLQGASYLWGVKYDTGGSVPLSLHGKALIPLSNGSSSEVSLTGLTDRKGRRSPGTPGKPGGVKLITNSGLKPLKKIIHIQEQ